MKRLSIGHVGLFTLLAAFAVGCADEDPTETDESEQTSDGIITAGDPYGVELPGGGTVVDEVKKPPVGAWKACPTCGPVPDPWKNIIGPVPDPWEPTASTGSNSGSGGKEKKGSGSKKP